MTDRDPPIVAQEYLSGVKVVDIGDLRVARGLSRRPYTSCRHNALLYDHSERRIWCSDCETNVEPFDAFLGLVEHFHAAAARIEAREKAVAEAERSAVRSLAAKAIDEAWRRRKYVPACPHCKTGLFPEDFAGGAKTTLSRDYAEALRARREKDRPK